MVLWPAKRPQVPSGAAVTDRTFPRSAFWGRFAANCICRNYHEAWKALQARVSMQSAKCRDSLQGPLGGFRSPHTSSLTAVLHCRDVQWNVRGQLHWCASSCLSTAVECICDLAQIDVIMRETCGNQDLPKVTGTGDARDPYPSAMRVHMLSCCGAYVVLFAFLSVAAPAQNPAPQQSAARGSTTAVDYNDAASKVRPDTFVHEGAQREAVCD